MVKNSSSMKKGDFQKAHTYRYVIAVAMFLVLFVLSLYRMEADSLGISMASGAFGSGAILVIGMLMGGLEGNKIASREGADE